MWIDPATGNLHYGDCLPGERLATDEEVAAWRSAQVTMESVQAECQRRIDAAVSLNQKLNMLGTMTATLLGVAALGQIATDAQKADAALFIQSMQWIAAMKAACAGLVGNVAYIDDASWPTLSETLKSFGARF